MSPNDADGMANSVDPDQTAPLGAVWSGSALFYPGIPVWKLRIITVILATILGISSTITESQSQQIRNKIIISTKQSITNIAKIVCWYIYNLNHNYMLQMCNWSKVFLFFFLEQNLQKK